MDDWPRMGEDLDKNGIGEPVIRFRKPNVGGSYAVATPQTSDEFDMRVLGVQWQWESNPGRNWYSLTASKGWLRLYSQASSDGLKNLWYAGNIFGCKMPAPEFSITTKLNFDSLSDGERSGLIVLGTDYSYIGIQKNNDHTG